jgi:hypothetical protein
MMAQNAGFTKGAPNVPPNLTHVVSLSVTVDPPLAIGRVDAGLREVIPMTGGALHGPLLNGKVLPGGADWCLTRPDGIAEVWARYTLALDNGQLVSVLNAGLAHPNPDGSYRGHTVPQFEAAHPSLDWLRRSVFVGTLLAHASGTQVDLAFYRLD